MSNIDSHVASVLDAHANRDPTSSDDEDALIAELEESDSLDGFREQRIQQLHAEFTREREQRQEGGGVYTEVKEEKPLMDTTTQNKYVVIHFAKDDFARCRTMDTHLEELAKKHFDTRFLKISVENAPFLVTKMKVQVLPCVIAFIDGNSVDRIIGFEGLGYTEHSFTTRDLEARLIRAGVLQRSRGVEEASIKFGVKAPKNEESDDEDWD